MGIITEKKSRNVFLRLAVSSLLISGGIAVVGGVLAFWFLSFLTHFPDRVKYIGICAMTGAGLLSGGRYFIYYLRLYRSDWSPIGKKVILQIKESKYPTLVGQSVEGTYINSIGKEVGEINLNAPLTIMGGSVRTLFFTTRKLKSYSENLSKGVIDISLSTVPESQSQDSSIAVADMHIEK
jgi:hypothetical protein